MRMPETVLVTAVIFFVAGGLKAAAEEAESSVALLLVADESPMSVETLQKQLSSKLRMSTVHILRGSEMRSIAQEHAYDYVARFHHDGQTTFLVLEKVGKSKETQKRAIPWITDPKYPITQTLSKKKSTALALLVENLILDFVEVPLMAVDSTGQSVKVYEEDTSPPQKTSEKPAKRRDVRQGNTEPAQMPLQRAPKEKQNVKWRASLLGGVTFLSQDNTVAPRIEIDGGYHFRTLRLVMSGFFESDSNLQIDARPIRTRVGGAGVGLTVQVNAFSKFTVGISGTLVLRVYAVRRSDLVEAEYRIWPDVGFQLGVTLQLSVFKRFGIILKPGVGYFPFARNVVITNGPKRRVGRICVPTTMGIVVYF